jgi:hypothetical protein
LKPFGSKRPLDQEKGIFPTELYLALKEHNTPEKFLLRRAIGKSNLLHKDGTWH